MALTRTANCATVGTRSARITIRSMTPIVHLGIDVAKDTLELHGPGLRRTLPNTVDGYAQLLEAASKLAGTAHFVCEASGGYERRLVAWLLAKEQRVSVCDPSRARQFGRVRGKLAKTDRIDAELLADFGRTLQPPPETRPEPVLVELGDVVRRRSQLAELLGVQRTQRQQLFDEPLIAQIDQLICVLEAQIAQLDDRLDQLVSDDRGLAARVKSLCQVEGVGRTTAIALLSELPEIGSLNRCQAASLAGLAPFNHDSGAGRGQRHIRGGRSGVRRALYMAALTATRCNPVLRPFYLQLRLRGKCHRLAITAVMRKLLVHLNKLIHDLNCPLASQHS